MFPVIMQYRAVHINLDLLYDAQSLISLKIPNGSAPIVVPVPAWLIPIAFKIVHDVGCSLQAIETAENLPSRLFFDAKASIAFTPARDNKLQVAHAARIPFEAARRKHPRRVVSSSIPRTPALMLEIKCDGKSSTAYLGSQATMSDMTTDDQDIKISELEGFEQVATILAGRPLHHFSRVHSFCYFHRRDEPSGDIWSDIELVMEELEPPRRRVGFRFHRVTDVSFSGFGQISGLYFQNIAERGWEKLRFEVGDYEESQIHLFCHGISLFEPARAIQ